MRYSFFDLYEPNTDEQQSLTPKEEVEWLPLQNHPVFTSTSSFNNSDSIAPVVGPRNLLAWDGASRLYFWDSTNQCLHRITIRLGEPDPTSVLAASPSKVLQANVQLDFVVHKISINRSGSTISLIGADGLCIMHLYGRTSTKSNSIICRTSVIGSQLYYTGSNVLRILQVLWHPYSDTHLGVLSSDSVFRLYNLSIDLVQPEQEYYLQSVEPGRSKSATSICPVDFAFGGDHLWDRFTVFFLFSDGSTYILCPIAPFGSFHKLESILEIYSDAQTFGLKSANQTAVSNSNLAISWLEATFPDLESQSIGNDDPSILRSHPYVLFDASLDLQGPLQKVRNHRDEGDGMNCVADCEGRAISFLYNLVIKDSILVSAWSGGQLQIDALADEIQPVWNLGCPPRVRSDSNENILGVAMICESFSRDLSTTKFDQALDGNVWLGHSPPLLRLAIVDLKLPHKIGNDSAISMFVDPLMSERIYLLHDGGIDSIILHSLPFTNQARGKYETIRAPTVHAILSTCPDGTSNTSPVCGFVSLSDAFGYSWIVGATGSEECILLDMKTWNVLLPIHDNIDKMPITSEESKETEIPDIISKELLSGPKVVLLPQASPNLRSTAADSIEGRSMLHQYFKLFHETYVEYAHKVYFELKHHGPHLKRFIDDHHACLAAAQQKLLKVEEKQFRLEDRMEHAIQQHQVLEERLIRLRNFPGAHKRPLFKAERQFKSELDHFAGVELDALRSSIEALTARLRRHTQSSKSNTINGSRQIWARKMHAAQDSQVSQLKSSLEKLSLVNDENLKRLKLVETTLRSKERS